MSFQVDAQQGFLRLGRLERCLPRSAQFCTKLGHARTPGGARRWAYGRCLASGERLRFGQGCFGVRVECREVWQGGSPWRAFLRLAAFPPAASPQPWLSRRGRAGGIVCRVSASELRLSHDLQTSVSVVAFARGAEGCRNGTKA